MVCPEHTHKHYYINEFVVKRNAEQHNNEFLADERENMRANRHNVNYNIF